MVNFHANAQYIFPWSRSDPISLFTAEAIYH